MDGLQQQLDQLMRLFREEQAANRAHREEMASRIEALSNKEGEDSGNGGRGGGGPRNGDRTVPRYAKLDFPKYNGSDDPLGWLSRCEHFFVHQQTPEAERVSLASFHLEGTAQLWYLQMLDDYPGISWTEFKAQCHLRFGPPIRSNKLGELAKLKQLGPVSEYQSQFETLVSRAGALTQQQKIQLYISGLKDYISVEVELHQPRDLATAMSVSRLYERRAGDASSSTTVPPSHTDRQIKRLTSAEMLDRRRKGLCFNCDEPFVRGHQCAKLFWFELVDPDPPDGAPQLATGT